MARPFSFLMFLLFTQNFAKGQDTNVIKYRIETAPFQYIFNDYHISVERVVKHRTIGFTISYKPSTANGGEVKGLGSGLFGKYENQNFQNDMYSGVTFGLNSKRYFSNFRNFYVEANLFYRYWWFDNKNCEYANVEGYRFNGTRTEKQNVYGLKILFGNTFQFGTRLKLKPTINLYYGIGLRYKAYKYETYKGTVYDKYYDYKKDIGGFLQPTLHIGLKAGFGW